MTRAGVARLSTALVASVCLSGLVVAAQGQGRRYSATLVPGQENPSLAAPGRGTIVLDVNEGSGEIGYQLSYRGPDGGHPGAHSFREARRQRRHHALALPDRHKPGS